MLMKLVGDIWGGYGTLGPAALFRQGENGGIYDPSVMATVAQDAAGSVPVTTVSQPVGRVGDASGNGLAATQGIAAARPNYARMPVGGRRNLLTRSQDFANAVWAKAGANVAVDVIAAPDGSITADKLQSNVATSALHRISCAFSFAAGVEYTFTLYAKRAEFDIAIGVVKTGPSAFSSYGFALTGDGAISHVSNALGDRFSSASADVGSVDNGWYRVTLRITSLDAALGSVIIDIMNGNLATSVAPINTGCHIWGAQVEAGSTATPYQAVAAADDITESGKASRYALFFDQIDDGLTATLPAGNYTVGWGDDAGVTILTEQALSGAYTLPAPDRLYGAVLVDRPLDVLETARLTAWLNARRP